MFRIKELREAGGLTQCKLAECAGISQIYLSYIENGHKIPSGNTLLRIAKALNTTVKNLYEDEHTQAG